VSSSAAVYSEWVLVLAEGMYCEVEMPDRWHDVACKVYTCSSVTSSATV